MESMGFTRKWTSHDGLSINLIDCLSSFLTIIMYIALPTIILSSYPLVKPRSSSGGSLFNPIIVVWICIVRVWLGLMVVHPKLCSGGIARDISSGAGALEVKEHVFWVSKNLGTWIFLI